MNFTLIQGTYFVVGFSPDGDSIKFKADNPRLWDTLITENRKQLEENLAEDNGIIMLRLQGIDAFETHYSPESPIMPKDLKIDSSSTLKKPEAGGYKQPMHIA